MPFRSDFGLTRRGFLQSVAALTAAGGVLTTLAPLSRAQTQSSRGELRIAVASFPNSMDALKETNVLRFGVGETLMRLTPTYELQPWLADHVDNIDPVTWHIALRPNARFHDGSPVTATDVVNAFQTNYQVYPDGNALISKNSQFTALDDLLRTGSTGTNVGDVQAALVP